MTFSVMHKVKPADDLPPVNTDAENRTIAALVLESRGFDNPTVRQLTPGDFLDESNRLMFGGMMALRQAGKPIDMTLLANHLSATGTLERAGGWSKLRAVAGMEATGAYSPFYAEAVIENSRRRRQWMLVRDLRRYVDDGLPPEDIDGAMEMYLEEMKTTRESKTVCDDGPLTRE